MVKPLGVTEKPCPLCNTVMIYHPPTKAGRNDYWWKCPDCGAEVWPEDVNVAKQIQRIMAQPMRAKKKFGGRKSGRKRKQKKPGDKLTPWYVR